MINKIEFEYKQKQDQTTCIIRVGDMPFTSLGLLSGQTELNAVEKAWFQEHEQAVIKACTDLSQKMKAMQADFQNHANCLAYQAAFNKWDKLLNNFCKDCKIQDS